MGQVRHDHRQVFLVARGGGELDDLVHEVHRRRWAHAAENADA